MTLINLTTLFGINPANIAASTKSVNFRGSEDSFGFYSNDLEPYKDSFSSNPIYEGLTDKNKIERIAKANPRIRELLGSNICVNMDVLKDMI